MIAYRAEIRCDGCGGYLRGMLHENPHEMPDAGIRIEQVAVEDAHWVKDGAAHFCPACQTQRGKAA